MKLLKLNKTHKTLLSLIFVLAIMLLNYYYPAKPSTQIENITKETTSTRSAETYKVTRIIDGDTIEIETGQKIRLIGINTPEIVAPNTKVQCYGKEASNFIKQLLQDQKVTLEKGISETDRYGRLLRYVYLNDIFVNEYLVKEGYAYASSYPPDVKYQEVFTIVQTSAREQSKGLWNACPTN